MGLRPLVGGADEPPRLACGEARFARGMLSGDRYLQAVTCCLLVGHVTLLDAQVAPMSTKPLEHFVAPQKQRDVVVELQQVPPLGFVQVVPSVPSVTSAPHAHESLVG